jgi:hypothetical protein
MLNIEGGREASAHFIRFPERRLSQQQQQQCHWQSEMSRIKFCFWLEKVK